MDQKIEILEISFRHIFTKQPGKPMFTGTLNTMSAIILTKLQSFGAKILFSISIAPDTHLKISSLFFIAILLLYSVQFFSLEPFDALHISTRNSHLFFLDSSLSSALSGSPHSIQPSSVLASHSLFFPLFFSYRREQSSRRQSAG